MEQGINIRKRRITYYDGFGRSSFNGKRIKKRLTKIQLLKTIFFVIVTLTFFLLLRLIYPVFIEEFASKFYRTGSQNNNYWNKYSSAALSSKPKDNYKFTEQVNSRDYLMGPEGRISEFETNLTFLLFFSTTTSNVASFHSDIYLRTLTRS